MPIINYNSMASNALRQLNINQSNQAKSMAKLSSGLRINTAADDAAGLAISEQMKGQIRGLDQASRNAQDGQSLVNTAEGALSQTTDILQRMRELAVQGSNDTNTSDDRTAIQQEVNQLSSEIDRIGNTTQFNTKNLLNGGASVSGTVTGTGTASGAITIAGGTGDTQVGSLTSITAATVATAANSSSTSSTLATTTNLTAASTMTINGVSFSFGTTDNGQSVLDKVNNANIGVKAAITGGHLTLTSTTVGSKSNLTVSNTSGDLAGLETVTAGTDATITGGATAYTADGNTITIQTGTEKGLQLNVNSAFSGAGNAAAVAVTTNGGLNLQIGANQNQSMYISINDMRSAALGVNQLDLTTTSGAENAITTVDKAISSVSAERAKLGAYSNRLDYTINNLNTSSQNTSDAQSRIADVDMAKEMMNQSKSSVLAQAAQSMLAQANQQPQQVLQLLR